MHWLAVPRTSLGVLKQFLRKVFKRHDVLCYTLQQTIGAKCHRHTYIQTEADIFSLINFSLMEDVR